MGEVLEVSENIYLIKCEEWKPMVGIQAYLIVDEKMVVIEPGPTAFVPEILDGLRKLGYDSTSPSYIIPTHIHMDHGGGTGYLAQQLPRAQIILHDRGASHLISPSKLIEGAKLSYGDDFEDRYGPILPVPEERCWIVQGGESLQLGERELRIIHSPGHAPHHICLYDTRSKGLFCGEAIGSHPPGTDIVVPSAFPPRFDPELALETISKLKSLAPAILFYGHFGIGHEVAKLIKLAEDSIKACGDIILEAMRAGVDSNQLFQSLKDFLGLEAYLASIPPASAKHVGSTMDWHIDSMIIAYGAHFKEKNMV